MPMSLRMINACKFLPVSPTQKLVLLCLADCHNGESDRCNPSYAHIMRFTGLSNRAVANALAALKMHGILDFKSRNGSRSSYQIIVKTSEPSSQLGDEDGANNHNKPVNLVHSLAGKAVNLVHQCSTFTSERRSKTCEPPAGVPVNLVPKPVNEVHINREEQGIEPERTGKGGVSRRRFTESESAKANAVPLPLLLATDPRFVEAWGIWCHWRTNVAMYGNAKGNKSPWTVVAAKRTIAKCEKLGIDRAINAIAHSADRWDDIYEPKEETTNTAKPNAKRQQFHHSGATGLANAPDRYATHNPPVRPC